LLALADSGGERGGDVSRYARLLVLLICVLVRPPLLPAEQVQVRHKEGLVHGFLVLRTLDGQIIADGDLIQNVRGDRVTSRLTFRFKDGSLHDETAIFSQRGRFRLLSDHLVQNGPSFKHPMDATLDATKTTSGHIDVPADVANGMTLVLMKNIRPDAPTTTVSMVAYAAKPRVIKLIITPQGEEAFSTGDARHKAMHYRVKIDIGGLSGLLADIFGKEPPDVNAWVLGGEAPAFVRSEGPLAYGGPIWRIELVSPAWPRTAGANPKPVPDTEKKKANP